MFVKHVPTERVHPNPTTRASHGKVVLEPAKTLWLCSMIAGGITGLVLYFSWAAFAVFLGLSAITICAGHSVGMHRLLIHRSFTSPLWVERTLVYLGTLVGMAGPHGMIRAHDMRDWHQRQTQCPPHPSHDAGFLRDAVWQLCCSFQLTNPPDFEIEEATKNDRFYKFLEATWMLQQLPLAMVLFYFGGIAWVLWGICLRIAVSLIGHWAVGHVAHKRGDQAWIIEGLPVQGYNLPRLGFLTFGESWHGNHHAFPHSAKLGLGKHQSDNGFVFIKLLERIGLATNIKGPDSELPRDGLVRLESGPLLDRGARFFVTTSHPSNIEGT